MQNKAISERLRKSKKFRAIRASLIDQLADNGADTTAFIDLVDDYMSLWIIKEMTKMDIKLRGVYIKYSNGGGQYGTKENPSVAYQLKITSQMMKILSQLRLSVENAGGTDDEL